MTATDIPLRTFAFALTLYGMAALLAGALYAASFAAFSWPVVVEWARS
jgi:hypothetical protein